MRIDDLLLKLPGVKLVELNPAIYEEDLNVLFLKRIPPDENLSIFENFLNISIDLSISFEFQATHNWVPHLAMLSCYK